MRALRAMFIYTPGACRAQMARGHERLRYLDTAT